MVRSEVLDEKCWGSRINFLRLNWEPRRLLRESSLSLLVFTLLGWGQGDGIIGTISARRRVLRQSSQTRHPASTTTVSHDPSRIDGK